LGELGLAELALPSASTTGDGGSSGGDDLAARLQRLLASEEPPASAGAAAAGSGDGAGGSCLAAAAGSGDLVALVAGNRLVACAARDLAADAPPWSGRGESLSGPRWRPLRLAAADGAAAALPAAASLTAVGWDAATGSALWVRGPADVFVVRFPPGGLGASSTGRSDGGGEAAAVEALLLAVPLHPELDGRQVSEKHTK
jgi:hypothetical protein